MKVNPMFKNIKTRDDVYDTSDTATYLGVTLKSLFLALFTTAAAAVTVFYLPKIIESNLLMFIFVLIGSSIISLIAAIVGRISDRMAKYCAVLYSACQGILLGTVTLIAELFYPGIGLLTVGGTLLIFFVMLTLYSIKAVRVTNGFKKFMFGFALGALIMSVFFFVVGLLFPAIYQYTGIYLIVCLFLLVYGVLMLLINFDEATHVVEMGLSKDAEWSVSFGIIITLVYIYVNLLRILLMILSKKK